MKKIALCEAFAQSVNLTTPLTKRNINVPCTLALLLTVNFSRYIIAPKGGLERLRWLLQRKRHFKVELYVTLSVL